MTLVLVSAMLAMGGRRQTFVTLSTVGAGDVNGHVEARTTLAVTKPIAAIST